MMRQASRRRRTEEANRSACGCCRVISRPIGTNRSELDGDLQGRRCRVERRLGMCADPLNDPRKPERNV